MQPNKSDFSKSALEREDAWMSILEAIVLFLATWLNPQAGIAVFALRLCFQILKALRHHHRPVLKSPEQQK
jgi:hypothetical protein